MDKIAVLIPCFNEKATIEKVVRDFSAALPEATVYVYDNNSTDGSDLIARSAGAVVRYEHQQGKGNVIRRMFSEIDAEVYLMVDGDNTYPAEAAPRMVSKVLSERADMVIGDRLSSNYFQENRRAFHSIGNSMVRACINTLFHCNIKDIMTGYRAFSYRFVKTFPVLSRGFEIETEMTIHAVDKNMLVYHEVIEYRNRPEGSISKLETYADGKKVIATILKLFRTYCPQKYYGVIACVLTLLSLWFFLPIMKTYSETGLVPRFPTLIVCGFVMISAIISFFAGLVLETINQKNHQDFEMNLCRATSEMQLKMDLYKREK